MLRVDGFAGSDVHPDVQRPRPPLTVGERGLAAPLRRVLTPGTPSNRILRIGLLMLAVAVGLRAFALLILNHPLGVDLEIPLRAAERWVNGDVVYDPAAFELTGGPDLPYLYPPAVLPFLVPLLALPRELVLVAWVLVCLGSAIWALRRLRTPWLVVPILLIWPPFTEGWLGGNVHMLLLALFVSMFIAPGSGAPDMHPVSRDPAATTEPLVRRGLQASLIAVFKVSQVHPWLYQLRYRPSSALAGAAILGAIVLVTVPVTGLGLWGEWLDQVRRAADTTWIIGGIGLGRMVAPAVGAVVAIASLVAVLFVPRKDTGAWVGVLSVVGGTSLRGYGLTFMLPAGYRIRRELALIAYAMAGTFTAPGAWLGIAMVAIAWVVGQRFRVLLEPDPARADPDLVPALPAAS